MTSTTLKGRPAQISRDEIINSALNIGYSELSMHKVAKDLNVSVSALYRHVKNKEELITCCAEHIYEGLNIEAKAEWQDTLVYFAQALRNRLLSIQSSVHFIRHNTQPLPSLCELSETALTQLKSTGFSPEAASMALAGTISHVSDMVLHQERAEIDNSNPVFDIQFESYPCLIWSLSDGNIDDHENNFEQGLKIILSGIENTYLR